MDRYRIGMASTLCGGSGRERNPWSLTGSARQLPALPGAKGREALKFLGYL